MKAFKTFQYTHPLELESGEKLQSVDIGYEAYGKLNENKDNVIWICHALTANADVADWWKGLVGEEGIINSNHYFIICANILGSCYGSSGPLTINPDTGKAYYANFPQITIRDIVKAHILLRERLGIKKIQLLAGGSMGGYQALEWALLEPEMINRLFLLATGGRESAWGIAIHAAQRLAIEADKSWIDPSPKAGNEGMKAARAIGMLTYRNYQTFVGKQTDDDFKKLDNFKAASYINYQGEKLTKRFLAQSYWLLTKAMDSHNIARSRTETIEEALQAIQQRSLIIGITSDILCPVEEQRFLAKNIPRAAYYEIDSPYGHDGFLIEFEKISKILLDWMPELEE